MRSKTKQEIEKLVHSIIQDYTITEAERMMDKARERRSERINELRAALSVMGPDSTGRDAVEDALAEIVLGGPPLIKVPMDKMGGQASAPSRNAPVQHDVEHPGLYL